MSTLESLFLGKPRRQEVEQLKKPSAWVPDLSPPTPHNPKAESEVQAHKNAPHNVEGGREVLATVPQAPTRIDKIVGYLWDDILPDDANMMPEPNGSLDKQNGMSSLTANSIEVAQTGSCSSPSRQKKATISSLQSKRVSVGVTCHHARLLGKLSGKVITSRKPSRTPLSWFNIATHASSARSKLTSPLNHYKPSPYPGHWLCGVWTL